MFLVAGFRDFCLGYVANLVECGGATARCGQS